MVKLKKDKAHFKKLVVKVTSREFLSSQKIRKVSARAWAYIKSYYILESTYELDRQSGGITGAGNNIELASGHGSVFILQKIEAVMKLVRYNCMTLQWYVRFTRAIPKHSGSYIQKEWKESALYWPNGDFRIVPHGTLATLLGLGK